MSDYLQLAQDIVKQTASDDIQAEAYIVDSYSTAIRVDSGEVEQLSQSGSQGIGIRIIDRGRVGYAYTSNFSIESLNATINAAKKLSQVATVDEHRGLPKLQDIPQENLEIYDPNLEYVSTDQKIVLAKRAEQIAMEADPRMIQAQSHYGDSLAHVFLANSNGFAGTYSRTSVYNYIIGTAKDENDSATGFGLGVSNFFSDLDPEVIGKETTYKTTLTLGATPVKTQVAPVVFDPIIFAQILSAIANALTANAMQRGMSFLLDKMGQDVASDKVTLLDNPRMKRGLASALFDGEGVPTSATRLIDEGVLQNVIYDTYSARRDGTTSTGNARRDSHRSLPELGPSNFYIQPGHKTQNEIIKGMEKGFYITHIMQTGGINPINGDCSMSASGIWVENGEFKHPVNGVTIATTLPDLLKNISEVGNDLTSVPLFDTISSPTVRVENITIGGTSE